jgi:hypothetical protein
MKYFGFRAQSYIIFPTFASDIRQKLQHQRGKPTQKPRHLPETHNK